ncbi:MAG: DUF2029 domain-containing protein [Niabella sp.]|nr:DUF2029 domain-containing protein [Niabella sp.]
MKGLLRLKDRMTFRSVFFNKKLAVTLWFGLSIIAILQNIFILRKFNNFLIFRQAYFHAVEKTNLYLLYPQQYFDVYLYGPVFSVLIAPFALLPLWLGVSCWVLFNVGFLYYALRKLPVQQQWQFALLIFCSNEMMGHSAWLQANAAVCACLVLAFALVRKEKEVWALLFIMLATFVKIYGIVGLAFFLLSKNKVKFIMWGIVWAVVCFFAPLLITNWSFLIQSYHDWYAALQHKSAKNIDVTIGYTSQDISVMGFIRRVFYHRLDDLFVLVPAALLQVSQFVYYRYYKDLRYQLYLLASILIFTVIFSNGSEAPTYIIALPGMCIWYILQPKTKRVNVFFAITFLFTTFCYSDIFTPYFRRYVAIPYSLKAVFPAVVWLIILIQIHCKQFLKIPDPEKCRIRNIE